MNYRRLTQHQSIEDIFFPIEEKAVPSYPTLFNPISNEALLMPIFQYCHYFFLNQPIQQVVESFGKKQFFVKFRLLEQEKTVLEKDKVYPQIIIENSYDGSIKPKIGLGFLRVICTNGMMHFDKLVEVNIENNSTLNIEDFSPIFEQLEKMDVVAAEVMPTFRRLANRRVNQREIDWLVREISQNRALHHTSRLIDRALLVASLEADALNTPMSAWLLYNGFNHALNHIPFAFKNTDLRALDQQILSIVEKVIRPGYQPIILPNKPTTFVKSKTVTQNRFCEDMAGV